MFPLIFHEELVIHRMEHLANENMYSIILFYANVCTCLLCMTFFLFSQVADVLLRPGVHPARMLRRSSLRLEDLDQKAKGLSVLFNTSKTFLSSGTMVTSPPPPRLFPIFISFSSLSIFPYIQCQQNVLLRK